MLMTRVGAGLIAIGSAAGLAISLYNYFMPVNLWDPDSSVTGTAGALLVVVSTAIILLAALVLAAGRNRSGRKAAGLDRGTDRGKRGKGRALRAFLVVGCLVGIVGSALAAYLLQSVPLFAAMAFCLIGWITMIAIPRKSYAA